jgi:putative ABC transport system substrate-binding protein
MRRREFITLLGGATAWPLAARAQQRESPIIGYLGTSPESTAQRLVAFRQGLADTGYREGGNVRIDYRWSKYDSDRFPQLAADLVSRRVSVITCPGGTAAALAAKAKTSEIPIVFGVGEDPVKLGLVASLSRPGGNATGVNFFTYELVSKRIGLLRELVPRAAHMVLLINPANPIAESTRTAAEASATAMNLRIRILNAASTEEIDKAFASMARERPDILLVGADPYFNSRRVQFATLTTRLSLPAIYSAREYAESGGLMSYGTDLSEMFRQVGVYTGYILNGAKPSDLPVWQSTKFDLVINLTTAKALGLDVPPTLLARADEVIE